MTGCAALTIVEQFYPADYSRRLYQRLVEEQPWPDNRYIVAGRQFVLPRLQTWHADPGIVYSYSNNLLQTRPWTTLLTDIRRQVENHLHTPFNSVLVNWYRNGNDSVGWHADNEAELGPQPLIASLTLGATRPFAFRRKHGTEQKQILLKSGTLLIMQPDFQHHWLHSVPTVADVTAGRINLTFRQVIPAPSSRLKPAHL